MNDDIAIQVNGVSKSFKLPHEKSASIKTAFLNFAKNGRGYEIQHVLKDISFEIKKGDFFGIVGRNGSGKSTLLKLISQIYIPNKGAINIRGSLTPFIELGVGFNPELTGRENVYMNGALLGFNNSEMDVMYDDVVEFAELEQFMDQKLKNYSSGMQVRLAFSIAIRANSDILVLDEVLAVGDAAFQQKCYDYFTRLRDEKKTIIFVTHDMSAVQRFCTRALYINNGEIKHIGSPNEVADIYVDENVKAINASDAIGIDGQHNCSLSTTSKSNDRDIEITFKAELPEGSKDAYIAFSLLHNGVAFAELNSSEEVLLTKSRTVVYQFEKEILNAGLYQITAVLCDKKTKKVLAISQTKPSFQIQGIDQSRGGPLRLKSNWKY